MICSACGNDFQGGEEYLQCCNEKCHKLYHYLCNNTDIPLEERANWICPECQCSKKKGGNNSDTPVGKLSANRNTNVTNRKKLPTRRNDDIATGGSDDKLALEVQSLREQIALLNCRIEELVTTVKVYDEKLHLSNQAVCILEERLEVLEVGSQNSVASYASAAKSGPTKEHTEQAKISSPNQLNTEQDNIVNPTEEDDSNGSGSLNNEEQRRPKQSRRSVSIRCTAGPEKTSLKAVERRKYLHLWNMESGTDDVRAYLEQLCPTGTCTLDPLKPKGEYKSYKIGVPVTFYDILLSPEVWPDNARIKEWTFFRGSRKTAKGKNERPSGKSNNERKGNSKSGVPECEGPKN